MVTDSLRCSMTILSPNPFLHPHILQSRKIRLYTQIPVWHQNGQINSQRCDPFNTILGSDIGLEKCRSRQTD